MLEKKKYNLPAFGQKLKKVEFEIEKLQAVIDLFIYRKRKTEDSQLKSLYNWFEDEFIVMHDHILEMIVGKEEEKKNDSE